MFLISQLTYYILEFAREFKNILEVTFKFLHQNLTFQVKNLYQMHIIVLLNEVILDGNLLIPLGGKYSLMRRSNTCRKSIWTMPKVTLM